jgi:hypothetical protein
MISSSFAGARNSQSRRPAIVVPQSPRTLPSKHYAFDFPIVVTLMAWWQWLALL